MDATLTKSIWLTRPGPECVVHAVQNDTGRAIDFVLEDMTAPNGSFATIYATIDGASMFNAATVATTDGQTVVTVPLTSNMLSAIGRWPCSVRIQNGDDIVTSFPFFLQVWESEYDDAAVEAQDEFTALEAALDTISGMDTRVSALEAGINANTVNLQDGSSRTLSGFLSTAVTDLDDAAYTGFYPYASTAANKPGNNGGVVLTVRQGANYIHQLAFMNYAAVTQQDVVYYRRYYSGSWTGWVQIAGASGGVSAPNAGNFTPTTYDRVTVYKRFGMGLFRFNINPAGTLTSNTDTVICNISSGCVPVVPMYYTMTDQSGGPYIVTIETNGDVKFNPRGHTGTAFIRGCLAFPT